MKKIFFSLFIITCTQCSFGQNIDLTVGSLTLPDGYKNIDTNTAKNHVLQKLKGNKMAYEMVSGMRSGRIYKVGDILVAIRSEQHNIETGHAQTIKKGLDEIFRNNPTYTSEIKNINNNVVLIVRHINKTGYCSIYANNARNTKLFTALLEYDPADSVKAKSVEDHIIKNLKFSN